MRRASVVVVLGLALLGFTSSAAKADVQWLCHPGTGASDPCEIPLDTTKVAPDGSRSTFTPSRVAEARRPVDCFYVYPTVSNQPTPNATKAPDPEIVAVTQSQAARFSRLCRMFVPLYREVTVANVAGNTMPGGPIAEAYGDVEEAFKDYLAKDNGGRGFILLGHSQGAIHLRQLIRTQVDKDPDVRRRFVGGFLLGGNTTTKAGATAGGDFNDVPLCTQRGQAGCVVAYSSYSTDPSQVSPFGDTNSDMLSNAFGEPHGAGYEVACVDPRGTLGAASPFGVLQPTKPFPPGSIAVGNATTLGDFPTADTTWVQAYQYQGGCKTITDHHVLRYDPVGNSPQLNESPPTWGTHLIDFQLGLDNLVRIGGAMRQTYLGDGLRSGAAAGRRLPVTVPGAGSVILTGSHVKRQRLVASGPQTLQLPLKRTGRKHRAGRTKLTITYRPGGAKTPIVRTTRARVR